MAHASLIRVSALLAAFAVEVSALVVGGEKINDATPGTPIVAPTREAPSQVAPGGVLEVQVKLRLPLTPPPGVQQPKANEGWRVTLVKREVHTLAGQSVPLDYVFPVMRLRPVKGDIYRLSVELFPWLLEGAYDLRVAGPGLVARREEAVIIGRGDGAVGNGALVMRPAGGSAFQISNPLPRPVSRRVNWLLGPEVAGIDMRADHRRISPVEIAFASVAEGGQSSRDRVLSYRLEIPGARDGLPGITTLSWTTVAEPACDASIIWPDAGRDLETMAWRDLRVASRTHPVSVIWNFGDGRWGIGEQVRYRFLLTNRAEVTATLFDSRGGICEAHSAMAINAFKRDRGCACTFPGQTSTRSPLRDAFFLFSRWVAE